MSSQKRKRDVQVNFRVSLEELSLIEQKMSQLGRVDKVEKIESGWGESKKKDAWVAS